MMDKREKVLLFRSGATWIVKRALEDLTGVEPKPLVDVLSPVAYAGEMAAMEGVNKVVTGNWEGMFRASSVTPELLAGLKAEGYDKVVVVYSDVHGENYDALRSLAFKIAPEGGVHTINCRLLWNRLAKEDRLIRYLLPRKWFYNLMLAVFCVEIVTTALWDRFTYALTSPFRKKGGAGT